jgi:hypothetical protein
MLAHFVKCARAMPAHGTRIRWRRTSTRSRAARSSAAAIPRSWLDKLAKREVITGLADLS